VNKTALAPDVTSGPYSTNAAVPVLYIGGYGRSGSTLLDMAFAQFPGVFGAGELGNLQRHVWKNNEYCACGAQVRACPMWSTIVGQWLKGEPAGTMEKYATLSERFESLSNPFTMLGVTTRGRAFLYYARLTRNLYRAIRATTGCEIIVDSSKSPSRALALSRIDGIDLSLLHLVRDGRGVAWSMMKSHAVDVRAGVQRPNGDVPALRTAHRWMAFNVLTEFAASRVGPGRSTRLRYEDFTANPLEALAPALKMLNVPQPPETAAVLDEIVPEHQVAGSRVRMGGPLHISHDASWKIRMPQQDRDKFKRRAGRILCRYGYD
jgi:hypothetical protein